MLLTVNEAGTREGAALARRAAKAGADGLMVVPSPIYHTNPEETVATLTAVAAAGGLPVMIYSNRLAYRVDVTVEIMEELATDDRCSSPSRNRRDDIRRSTEIINRFGDRYDLFTGVDNLAFEALSVGAIGWVAGLVTAFPRETVAIYQLMKAGPPRRGAGHLPLVPAAARPRRLDLSRPEHQARRGACDRHQRPRAHAAPAAVGRARARRSRRSSRTRSRRGRSCRSSRWSKAAESHRRMPSACAAEIRAPTSPSSAPASSASAPPPISPRPGTKVTVIDRTGICEETSSGNAAAFAFSDVLPLAHKGMMRQLPKWLADPLGPLCHPAGLSAEAAALAVALLARRRRRQLRGEPCRAGRPDEARRSRMDGPDASAPARDSMLREDGSLELYESEAEFRASLPGWAARDRFGIAYRHVEGDELPTFSPACRSSFINAAPSCRAGRRSSDPKDLGKAIWALCRAEGRRVRAAATSGWRMPSTGAHRDPARARAHDHGAAAGDRRRRLVASAGAASSATASRSRPSAATTRRCRRPPST